MKKIITLFTMLAFLTLTVQAQLARKNPNVLKSVPVKETIKKGYESPVLPKGSYLKQAASNPSYGDTVGYTWYDYQTNSGMQQRIYEDANGNIQVIWTKALDTINDPANANRGVGYNYYDATSMTWIPGDSNNTPFGIAEKRVGWPSIAPISGGGEAIFAHTDRLYTNPAKGQTNWTANDLAASAHSSSGVTFYHSTAEGNTIYVLYDNGVTFYFGRSDDGGATWAISDYSIDSAIAPLQPISADGYDIDVKGDSVAVVTGGATGFTGVEPNPIVLYLSTDKGATWNATTIHVFDTINATFDTASGGYAVETPHPDVRVLIGSDGRIHVGGSLVGVQTAPGSLLSGGSWYPLFRGVWYWNSDMPAGFDVNDSADYATYVLVDSIPDMTTMGSYPSASADQGNYVTGSFSHVNLSEDAAGDLYIVFSGITAGSDNNPFDSRFRRDLFAMTSRDGGMNWSNPESVAMIAFANDITDGTVGEEAFPVTPKRIQNDIHILFQYDSWAGPTLTDDQPILEENKMTVYSLDPSALAVGLENDITEESMRIFPNPTEGKANLVFESVVKGETTVTVSNMIGQTMKVINTEIVNGSNTVELDLSDLDTGIYLVSLGTGKVKVTQKLVIE